MKSYILLASIALLAFAACKKDHSCTCKVSASVPGFGSADSSYIIQLGKTKKKDAKATCSANENSASFNDPSSGISYSVKTTCTLN